ncbi:MAG: response regulator transcription factor [Flavobacteriales bacterium]|nr:response regulator transcription factor [Flavobacteriales bacterium]
MAARPPIALRIVEDDPVIREVLSAVFIATEGIRLRGVHGSAEEILATADVQEAPDVVIMDINLPGASGIECIIGLRHRWPDAQFMMYTVNDTDELVFEALRAGANGYLLKNASPERIAASVFDIHQGGAPMSMTVARRVIRHFRPAPAGGLQVAAGLSDRDMAVLELLAEGSLYKEIADRFGVSEGTVKQSIHRIYKKMHVGNRTEAVNRYYGR